MIKLKRLDALSKHIRQDDVLELAVPTWTLVREAVKAGRADEALRFLEYGLAEGRMMQDATVS